jgi:hypothetical protein
MFGFVEPGCQRAYGYGVVEIRIQWLSSTFISSNGYALVRGLTAGLRETPPERIVGGNGSGGTGDQGEGGRGRMERAGEGSAQSGAIVRR